MKTSCSIVIRAYNEEKHIGRLLDGIAQQTVRDTQVILVDSGSEDKTVKIAEERGVDIIRIAPEAFSFGRSLNAGIERARHEFVVIASAHVYPVYPDWLEQMLKPFLDEKVALTYGKQRGNAESHYAEQQIFKHWYPDFSAADQDHPFCNNANAAVRRSLWEIHPYDEKIPALEDLAWAKWACDQGYRIAYCSDAEIIHVHQQNWEGIRNRYRREGMAFKLIYPHERFSAFDLVKLFLTNTISDFRAGIREKKGFTIVKEIAQFRWSQFYGTYLGYRQSGPLTWKLKQSFYYPRTGETEYNGNNGRSVAPIQYNTHGGKEDSG